MVSGRRDKMIEYGQYGLGISLTLIGFFILWYLDKDSFSENDLKNSDAILLNPSNQVRWRSIDDIDWKNVSDRAGLHFGDSIFTGEKSSASLWLKDLKLDLSQNTLMILKSLNEVPQVSIDLGTIQMKMSKNQDQLKVQFQNQEMLLKKLIGNEAQFSISTSDQSTSDKSLGISVSNGDMELLNGSNEKLKLKSGDSLLVENVNNQISYKKIEFVLSSDLRRTFITHKEFPKIKWKLLNARPKKWFIGHSTNQSNYDFELIDDKYIEPGQKPAQSQLSSDEFFYQINKKMSPGRHYFQLKMENDKGNEFFSNFIYIDIIELRPPTIFDHVITFLKPHESKIKISIESIPYLDEYEVDLFKKLDVPHKIKSINSKNSSPEFLVQGHDPYYAKVRYRLIGLDEPSPWTEFIQIVIPPALGIPRGKIVEYDLNRDRVLVKWNQVDRADEYELKGGKAAVSENKNKYIDTQAWRALLSDRPQNLFIIAKKENGQFSEPSSPIIIPGYLSPPDWVSYQRNPEPLPRYKKSNLSTPSIYLKWKSKGSRSLTQIELADNQGFKKSKFYYARNQQAIVPIDTPSTLFVRIRDFSNNPHYIGKFSPAVKLPVPPPETLLSPEHLSPKDHEAMLLIRKYGSNIELKWTSCKNALRYDLEVQRDDPEKGPISQIFKGLGKNEFSYKKPKSGKYKWRTKCLNTYLESDWSSFKEFSVSYGK